MSERTLLDEIFSAKEEDVETFMEAMRDKIGAEDMSDFGNDGDKFSGNADKSKFNGEKEPISAPDLYDQISGAIKITNGWHGDDYVWHISTANPRQQFKIDGRRLLHAVAKIMNATIPTSTEVKIWLPYADWEIQEYTFKAIDLKLCWQISQKSIDDMNVTMFTFLNTLV